MTSHFFVSFRGWRMEKKWHFKYALEFALNRDVCVFRFGVPIRTCTPGILLGTITGTVHQITYTPISTYGKLITTTASISYILIGTFLNNQWHCKVTESVGMMIRVFSDSIFGGYWTRTLLHNAVMIRMQTSWHCWVIQLVHHEKEESLQQAHFIKGLLYMSRSVSTSVPERSS
jgi:hypothetical protein